MTAEMEVKWKKWKVNKKKRHKEKGQGELSRLREEYLAGGPTIQWS